jgi:hypothetical protein
MAVDNCRSVSWGGEGVAVAVLCVSCVVDLFHSCGDDLASSYVPFLAVLKFQ